MSAALQERKTRKTITLIFPGRHDNPEGVLLKVTPLTAEIIGEMEKLSEPQRKEVMRVIHAVKSERFPYTAAEVEAWTPAQRRAVIDLLPEYTA